MPPPVKSRKTKVEIKLGNDTNLQKKPTRTREFSKILVEALGPILIYSPKGNVVIIS